jgi:hypothetical protein
MIMQNPENQILVFACLFGRAHLFDTALQSKRVRF